MQTGNGTKTREKKIVIIILIIVLLTGRHSLELYSNNTFGGHKPISFMPRGHMHEAPIVTLTVQ